MAIKKKPRKKGPVVAKSITYDGIKFSSGLEKNMYMMLKKAKLKFEYEGETFTLFEGFNFMTECYERQSNGKGEYKNRGGRVTAGSDNGFIYQTYGFGYVRELELLREAGFHPLEVIRSATLYGAQALGLEKDLGTVEQGKLADLVLVNANPLKNLQVLYGTGAIELDTKGTVMRTGGVAYTIKDGIIYDAKLLLKQVKQMVDDAKEKEKFKITQPGM